MGDVVERSSHYYDTDRNSSKISEATESDYNDFWENAYTLNPTTNAVKEDKNEFNLSSSVDTISLSDSDNMPPWDHSDMEALNSIDLNLDATSKNGFWKYSEGQILKDIQEYLSGTYRSHYTSQESKTQTLDLIEGIGDAEPFCRSNAIKYLSRFGKKNGKSKLDILKAIHYCILLYHFSGLHNANKNGYETF